MDFKSTFISLKKNLVYFTQGSLPISKIKSNLPYPLALFGSCLRFHVRLQSLSAVGSVTSFLP